MKALLLKDLMSLKRQGRIFLLLLVFYFVFSVGKHNVGILQGVMMLFGVIMTVSSMAYDEMVKWDRYALSLPMSRKTVVRSKYALGILLGLGGSLVATLLNLLICVFIKDIPVSEVLLVSLVMAGVGLLYLSLILPILFRFGAEKGRLLMMGVIFLPVLAIVLFSNLGIRLPDLKWSPLLGCAAAVIILALLVLSVFVSTKIYHKKEF